MKKFLLLSALMFIGAYFFVGCSSEENEGISVEAQLENIKQKYLHYAELYGVEDLFFIDEQLVQHLNLTDKQIEQDVIHLAVLSGKLDANASEIRKKFRTRSAGEPEEYYNWIRAEAYCSFSDTKVVNDSITINITVDFNYSEFGRVKISNKSATISRKYRCGDSSCTALHLDPIEYPAYFDSFSLDVPLVTITKEEGAQVYFTINYDGKIKKKDQGFNIEEDIDTKLPIHATGTVHILNKK